MTDLSRNKVPFDFIEVEITFYAMPSRFYSANTRE